MDLTKEERKTRPIATGVLDYFPDAIAEVAYCSWVGNEQHNPGEKLHWAREKSTDEADALIRHFLERGALDSDGVKHSAKVAWRALALLQKEIEAERETGENDLGSLKATDLEPGCKLHSRAGYGCTRVKGHDGVHIAHGCESQVIEIWENI